MKTFYHGTTDSVLPEILREGLHHKPEQRWKVTFAKGVNNESLKEPYVYLGEEISGAAAYAVQRVAYLRESPGRMFFTGLFQPQVKNIGAPVEITKPVILEINLPDDWPVSDDPQSDGFRTLKPVPPEYISVANKHALLNDATDFIKQHFVDIPAPPEDRLRPSAILLEFASMMGVSPESLSPETSVMIDSIAA